MSFTGTFTIPGGLEAAPSATLCLGTADDAMNRKMKEVTRGSIVPRNRYAFINLASYMILLFLSAYLGRSGVTYFRIFWGEPIAALPPISPFAVSLLFLVLIYFFSLVCIYRVLARRPPSRAFVLGVYLLSAFLVLYRLTEPLQLGRPILPTLEEARAELVEVRTRIAQELKHRPARRTVSLEELLSEPRNPSPWSSYGRNLPFRVIQERGLGPRLESLTGDLPGTIYLVVSPVEDRFWLTILVLDASPVGSIAFLPALDQGPCVLSHRRALCRSEEP